jgi:hypothetical protein
MVCRHLRELERAIVAQGIPETYRGEAWSKECREWVYYACYLDTKEIRKRFRLAACVVDHEHLGTHDGAEAGFYCTVHHDGIMGIHKHHLAQTGMPTFVGGR